MKFFINLIKVVIALVVLAALIIGAVIGYESYQNNKEKQAELSYETKEAWEWHQTYPRIQKRFFVEINKTVLRRVYTDKKYAIYAYKGDDYELKAQVLFFMQCEPNTEIITGKKFSDDVDKVLSCNEDGDALTYGVVWNNTSESFTWSEEFKGFEFSERLSDWILNY